LTPALQADVAAVALPPRLLYEVAILFGLLSASARVHIVGLLASSDPDVSTLAAATGDGKATGSHHLGALRVAGMVSAQRAGKRRI
jgi:DNA-binding transcriptional ArsR family regulator